MSSPSQNQAAWRRLPIRRAPAQPIGAGSTAVDLSAYTVGAVLALVPDADMRIVASNTGAAPTAQADDFPLVADTVTEWKYGAGDQLAAIGAGNLSIFETG